MKKGLLLSEYSPLSECVTKKTIIKKPKYPVIDIHSHMGSLVLGNDYDKLYDTDAYIKRLKDLGVCHIVNLDGAYGKEFDKMRNKIGSHSDFISNFVWIDISKIEENNFGKLVEEHLYDAKKKGAKGIKMWKNISLGTKDSTGKYIRIDDSRLDIVYTLAGKLEMPVLMHIADPTAFFKPIDKYNERYEELIENPSWSFADPKYYRFNELMEMQDNIIEKHPDTTFIIAHFGSYAENLKHVSERLDKYPNMYIDIAARVAELGRVPYSARKFFIKYADRILFGTDDSPLNTEEYQIYYRFLETDDEYFPYCSENEIPGQGRWNIYGLYLPEDILKKIYYKNAMRLLKLNEIELINLK